MPAGRRLRARLSQFIAWELRAGRHPVGNISPNTAHFARFIRLCALGAT